MSNKPAMPCIYIGFGLRYYKHHRELPRAVVDVVDVGGILQEAGYATDITKSPNLGAAQAALDDQLADRFPAGGTLILLWAGHAEPGANGLQLVTSEAVPGWSWISAATLAGRAALSGASQILLVLDTCFSGQAVTEVLAAANRVQDELPALESGRWMGVVASTQAWDPANDGLFGAHLLRLLRHGPRDARVRLRWSEQNEWVVGDDVIATIVDDWQHPASQAPTRGTRGRASKALIRNPLWTPEAGDQIVEHLLLAAQGREPTEEGSYFTGRTKVMSRIVSWLAAGQPGVLVVRGPAGCGKSAIVGRVVSLSQPTERQRLLEGPPIEPDDPEKESIQAHVHARGLDAKRVVELLDRQLVRARVLSRHPPGDRTPDELERALGRLDVMPAIAIDGLDEAREEAWPIAEFLRRVAGRVRILVGTRDLPPRLRPSPLEAPPGPQEGIAVSTRPEDLSLIGTLAPSVVVDLGAEGLRAQTATDVRRYVEKRLAGFEATMDADKVAQAVVAGVASEDEGLFLLARVITAQLRREAVDTSVPGWEGKLSRSLEAAFDRDLASVPSLVRDGLALDHAAAELLEALAWSYGAGFPDDVWPVFASGLSRSATVYRRDDVFWVLTQAGRYIVESGEDGRAAYRLSHQRLVQHLRGGDGVVVS